MLERINVIQHGKGTGVVEVCKDPNFGEKGTTRSVEFVLEPGTGFQLHVHPKMRETFTAVEGALSVLTIDAATRTDGPIVELHELNRGESFVVEPQTPHFVFNSGSETLKAEACMMITESGGKTVNFDVDYGNLEG